MTEKVEQGNTRVNVSIGTAAILGLAEVAMAVAPTTAYLMLGGRCLMNCAFCAQAQNSHASALNLSRVTWPEFDLNEVLPRIKVAASQGTIKRACLQVTVTGNSFEQSMSVLEAVKATSNVPFDIAILPRNLRQVQQLVEAGADHIGFGLDAANERVFSKVKGGSWERSLALIEETARAFPGRATVHLIVGLGETEEEMVERLQWAHDRGVISGLFAFTPVRGSHLADQPPPSLVTYRRMQAARWLIVHDLARMEGMVFGSEGGLLDLGAALPAGGQAFETSGCPDCNRPYYNERPGGPLYNYPRPLNREEQVRALDEMSMRRTEIKT